MLAVPLLAGCDGPLSTLAPAGPAAQQIARLWWVMLGGSTLITLLVGVMIWMALRRKGNDQAAGPGRERFWIMGWGLGFSMTVLTALLVFALWTGERMLARDDATPLMQAEAQQWGWRFVQPGPGGAPVETRGVLYVPAGRPFDVAITARDVIHSFWVPQLGGKMDAIPGHLNTHRLTADRPGIFEGLCAEFCGLGHSAMRFTVVAYDPALPLPVFEDAIAEDPAPARRQAADPSVADPVADPAADPAIPDPTIPDPAIPDPGTPDPAAATAAPTAATPRTDPTTTPEEPRL